MTVFQNSTFLDAFGANLYTAQQYQDLANGSWATLAWLFQYGATSTTVDPAARDKTITVALVLDRANDPASLLSGNWAQRQAGLAALGSPDAVWATYGADPALYNATVAQIAALVGSAALTAPTDLGYVSSAADRTIWVTVDSAQFATLFGTTLLEVTSATGKTLAWAGNLDLNAAVTSGAIAGLWFEQQAGITNPTVLFTDPVTLTKGPLGIGNASADAVMATPAAIAAHYNFPLGADVATAPIALVEPNVPDQAALFAAYNQYRVQVGLAPVTEAQFQILSGTNVPGSTSGELTLDISVIAGAAPNSSQLLYSMLSGSPYNAYQQAFFDTVHQPAVLSSSFGIIGQRTAQSPFYWAFQQLMIDGVLANVSVHRAAGDLGSSAAIANGAANYPSDHSSPFDLLVGGTSIVGLSSALSDPTLESLLHLALQDDPGTVYALVAAGLKSLPSSLSAAAPGPFGAADTLTMLFETVWQSLVVEAADRNHKPVLEVGFGSKQVGSGGLAPTVPIPDYQSAFGLASLTGGARGLPDVAALSSGDSHYAVLNSSYLDGTQTNLIGQGGGTSAASPLWASLTAQFNAIFHDQGLPDLGFYNDLLYIAAVVAPGSFNDIQLGDNVTSFFTTRDDVTSDYFNPFLGLYMIPTGHGYSATVGYDLVSGLGTPNGLLLARSLSAIAHSQVSFSSSPAMLDDDGNGGWQSGADQALLFQTTSPGSGSTVLLDLGGESSTFASGASGSFAWSSRLAQQSLQADFDPGLVLLFDRQAQGASGYAHVGGSASLSLAIDGVAGNAVQASLSNSFGFADFFASTDTVRVARSVMVAETVGGQYDQTAVLRLRQGGENTLQLTVYKVDDLAGTIEGLTPGHAAYAAAVQGRAYQTMSGDTSITGPGYGQFAQVLLTGVDAGDFIAMRLDNLTTGAFYWAFANANESVGGQAVNHLWNYGLNTYGWEDTYGGGDQDFNDLVVQLDFTSASGHGWLV
ncbi:DUF4114 domain-containing protein [Reyranella sp.]|uniref:DUF4114 domain-containing protein n=1 Tax=Reyranella sp. TaxID=1929291 RepID=UPI003BA8ADA4